MSKIQEETALMLERAEGLAGLIALLRAESNAQAIAEQLVEKLIPAFEKVRAQAQIELESPEGLSELVSDNYHSMLSGIESKWGEGYSELQEDDSPLAEDWMNGIRHASKIHTLSRIASGIESSGYPEPPAIPEGHGGKTKWPPGGPC